MCAGVVGCGQNLFGKKKVIFEAYRVTFVSKKRVKTRVSHGPHSTPPKYEKTLFTVFAALVGASFALYEGHPYLEFAFFSQKSLQKKS